MKQRNDATAVGLICNPHSGRNRKHLDTIRRLVAEFPRIHYVPTHTSDDLPAALEQLAGHGISALAINGGDGTVAHVLTHLLRLPQWQQAPLPDLILLPGGTTNMNVGDVGVPGKVVDGIRKLGRWSEGGITDYQVVARPVLRVLPGADEEPLYGMFFGTGAIIQGIEYWHERVRANGFRDELSSGLAMVRTVWGLLRRDPRFTRPVTLSAQLDRGQRIDGEAALLLFVTGMERVFLGFRPYWGDEPGALHASFIRDNPERFLRTLPVILRGRGRGHPRVTREAGYRSHNIEHMQIHMNGAFTLDGDIHYVNEQNGPVEVSNFGPMNFIRF